MSRLIKEKNYYFFTNLQKCDIKNVKFKKKNALIIIKKKKGNEAIIIFP